MLKTVVLTGLVELFTVDQEQRVQEVKLQHFLDVGHKWIFWVVEGVNVDAERCAGHHIHTVRPEEPEHMQTREIYYHHHHLINI